MNQEKEISVIANTMVEPGLSGGNRIFIELAKCWINQGIKVNIYTSEEGEKICLENSLNKASFYVWKLPKEFKKKKRFSRFDIFVLYLIGIVKGLSKFKKNPPRKKTVIWSTSDYWPDSIIGIFSKILIRKITWIGSLFLFAPNPFVGFREKGDFSLPSLKNVVFYLSQLPVFLITNILADFVFVTSQPDKDKFVNAGRNPDDVFVIKGGVDTKWADEHFKTKKAEKENKEYEACFVGRFHPQKGVLELVDIWKEVCKKNKKAKLVMIGNGELEEAVKQKINKNKLQNNIILKGFLGDGKEKFEVFKKSKIILHPAVYDSGGMAAAEAMVWGLPGVSFDLEALKTYYPYGMLKAKIGDIKGFSNLILKLLSDNNLYYNTSTKARELILEEWNWDKKASFLSSKIFKK